MSDSMELDPAVVEIGKFYARPPEVVWGGITEPDLLAQWLMRPVGFDTTIGNRFILAVPTRPTGEIACEILRVRQGERLGYSWVDLRAPSPARWTLDFSLASQGRGTRLLLTHAGFDISDRKQKMARNALERGWKVALSKLNDVLDG
ncbi:SRPBCC domain-containing protein [Rhodococcus sp. H29-C3]|uniref:SRPBCC family protein n=1 Tax=Rhodococcus sp. H29-C3 TaxID=3046307 RepID=UPI0024BBDC1E|nr:SRPBCC domain-containing protein [Rhodococcus sp. H29-C3]MDJ0363096.1 SRPBCC domain-containing protein [Rhodococcus sp. H29-C3]